MKPLYTILARTIDAYDRCIATGNKEWQDKHEDKILSLVKEHFPSGSGFDSGTTLDFDKSHSEMLVFNTAYHHMNEHGFYDGWTEHTVRVKPSLTFGYTVSISGRDRNDIKEYMHEVFNTALSLELDDMYGATE